MEQIADLDSILAYPRPRPRLNSFKTKTKTKTNVQDQDRDSRLTRPILEVYDWDGLWQTKRLKKSWQAENPAYRYSCTQ